MEPQAGSRVRNATPCSQGLLSFSLSLNHASILEQRPRGLRVECVCLMGMFAALQDGCSFKCQAQTWMEISRCRRLGWCWTQECRVNSSDIVHPSSVFPTNQEWANVLMHAPSCLKFVRRQPHASVLTIRLVWDRTDLVVFSCIHPKGVPRAGILLSLSSISL